MSSVRWLVEGGGWRKQLAKMFEISLNFSVFQKYTHKRQISFCGADTHLHTDM